MQDFLQDVSEFAASLACKFLVRGLCMGKIRCIYVVSKCTVKVRQKYLQQCWKIGFSVFRGVSKLVNNLSLINKLRLKLIYIDSA